MYAHISLKKNKGANNSLSPRKQAYKCDYFEDSFLGFVISNQKSQNLKKTRLPDLARIGRKKKF